MQVFDMSDRERLMFKASVGLLTTALIALAGVVAGSSGFLEAWDHFNWMYAVRTFTGVMGSLLGIVAVALLMEMKISSRKWWLFGGFLGASVLFFTAFAGLW
jgi:hypothetical protein